MRCLSCVPAVSQSGLRYRLRLPAQDSHSSVWRGEEDKLPCTHSQCAGKSTEGWLHWGSAFLTRHRIYLKNKSNLYSEVTLPLQSCSITWTCFCEMFLNRTSSFGSQVQLSAVTPPPVTASAPTGLEDSLSISSAPPTMPTELQTGAGRLLLNSVTPVHFCLRLHP